MPADVSKEEQVHNMCRRQKILRKIDVFFNNAGVEGAINLIKTPRKALKPLFNVNIKGVFYGLKYELRVMAEQNPFHYHYFLYRVRDAFYKRLRSL